MLTCYSKVTRIFSSVIIRKEGIQGSRAIFVVRILLKRNEIFCFFLKNHWFGSLWCKNSRNCGVWKKGSRWDANGRKSVTVSFFRSFDKILNILSLGYEASVTNDRCTFVTGHPVDFRTCAKISKIRRRGEFRRRDESLLSHLFSWLAPFLSHIFWHSSIS